MRTTIWTSPDVADVRDAGVAGADLAVGSAGEGFGFGADQLATVDKWNGSRRCLAQWQEFKQKVRTSWTRQYAAQAGRLAFFVLTAVLLLANVEKSFNRVWGVDKNRSLLRQVANYTSVLVLVPVLIGAAGALKAQVAINRKIFEVDVNAWAQNLASFGILWLAIGFLYVFVPNTRVRLRPASRAAETSLVSSAGCRCSRVAVGVVNYYRITARRRRAVFMLWM
jgi:hypothetical protein